MTDYSDLSLKQRAFLDLKQVEDYVGKGQVSWDDWREDTKAYWENEKEIGQEIEDFDTFVEQPGPGRPVEFPESERHQYNRDTQRRFKDKKQKIIEALKNNREVSEELRNRILSKISELGRLNVHPGVGRLTKELGDVERWEVEYAVRVLVREDKLKIIGRNIFPRSQEVRQN